MRYVNRIPRINSNELYEEFFFDRGVNHIEQYNTPILNYPTVEEISNLSLTNHLWTYGDRYYKLSHKYYGDSKWWWVIAWFNKKPTEAHVKRGQVIVIPSPLEEILAYYDY
jgi:nucleoid-associated protein YgaU